MTTRPRIRACTGQGRAAGEFGEVVGGVEAFDLLAPVVAPSEVVPLQIFPNLDRQNPQQYAARCGAPKPPAFSVRRTEFSWSKRDGETIPADDLPGKRVNRD